MKFCLLLRVQKSFSFCTQKDVFFHSPVPPRRRLLVVVQVRGNNVSLCVFVLDDGCAFYCLLLSFFEMVFLSEKWIYGIRSCGISETSIIVSNCVFALENWLQTFSFIRWIFFSDLFVNVKASNCDCD